MKRSEAVGMLAGYLSTMDNFNDEHPETLVPLAEYAISGLERMGVLPEDLWEKESFELFAQLVKGIP